MILLLTFLLALSQRSFAQGEAGGYMLMDTTGLTAQGNYSIGYVNRTTSTSSCNRIGMFKFPAMNSGLASTITVNLLTDDATQTCYIGFELFVFPSGQQIGSQFIGTITSPVLTTTDFISLDVSNANWILNNGTLYYLIINTMKSAGNRCNMKISCGQDNSSPSVYSIVTQQGQIDTPCEFTSWNNHVQADGGFINMRIGGQPLTATSTMTPSVTPSVLMYKTYSATSSTTRLSKVSGSISRCWSVSNLPPIYISMSPLPSPLTTNSMKSKPVNTSMFTSLPIVSKSVIDNTVAGLLVSLIVGFIIGKFTH